MKYTQYIRSTMLMATLLTLTACGGGGGSEGGTGGGGNQNQAPTAVAGNDISVDEQSSVTLTGSGSDSDGTISAYSWQQTSGTSVELSDSSSASANFTSPTLINAEDLTFELTVTDNQGLNDTDSVTVTVTPVNNAPTAQAGNDITVDEQQNVTLNGSGTDTDGSIVSYSWTQTDGTAVTLTNADTANLNFISPTVTNSEQLTFTLTVTDNEDLSASDSITVTVNPVNGQPVASAGDDVTVSEQTLVTLTGSASDDDGSIASYQWNQTSGTSVSLSNASTASVSFTTPSATIAETLTFTLTVTDNEGLTATDSVAVNVIPTNSTPTVSAGNDITVEEHTGVRLEAIASDADGTIESYLWTQTEGTSVTLNHPYQSVSAFTSPKVTATETLTFAVTVTDNEGLTATDSMTVTVTPVNEAPTVSAGEDVTVDEHSTVELQSTASDPDGTIESYLWTQTSGSNVTLNDRSQSVLAFTSPTIENIETLTFSLTVTDNEGLTASDSVTVTVNPIDETPTVSAGDDITVEGQSNVRLEGTASDADGTIESYLWTQTSGTTVYMNHPDQLVTGFTSPIVTSAETLTFSFTATDNDGLSGTDSITVTVVPRNIAPTVSAGSDQSVKSQNTVTLSGTASDSDGEIASVTWAQTQGTSVTLSNSSELSTTFVAPQVTEEEEVLTFSLTATDNGGRSTTDTVNITIEPENYAPTVSAGNNRYVVKGSNVTLSGSASDRDGEITQYQWTQTSGTTVSLTNADSASAQFIAPEQLGTLTFALAVTDDFGATASATVNIEVVESGSFFLVDSQQQASAYEPSTTLKWSVQNYDSSKHTLTWNVTTTAPLLYDTFGSSIDNPNTITFTTLLVAQDTDVTVEVTLDEGGYIHNMSKTITMLAQGNVKFDMRQQDNGTKADLGSTETLVMDISNDGFDDIISKDKIALGSATGQLRLQHIASGIEATEFSIADINNDGLQDILLSNDSQISWSLNSNDGNPFSQYEVINVPANISLQSTQAGDFDGDGDTDLATVYSSGNRIVLGWYEKENGVLKDSNIIHGNLIEDNSHTGNGTLVVGNFTNNGKTDILVATSSINDSRPAYLFAHTNDSNFTQTTAYTLTGGNAYATYYTRGVSASDLNQDGFDDIITWQSGTFFNNDNAKSFYYFSNQDSTFSGGTLHTSDDTTFSWNTVDIDGDGDLDIIHGNAKGFFYGDIGSSSAHSYSGKLIWYENLGSSFSTVKKVIMNHDDAYSMNVGDFDNDGDIDITSNDWYSENQLDQADGQNQAPTAQAGDDQTADEKTTVTLTGSGTDSDGTVEVYRWEALQGSSVILTSTSSATTSFTAPTVTQTENITFQLTVYDDKGLRNTDTVVITINPVNEAPSASAGDDATVDEQTEVTLNGSGTDPDNNLTSYSWAQTSGTTVTLTDADKASVSFTAPTVTASEELTFELTVTDIDGLTATDSVTVTINPVNTAPVVAAGDNQTVDAQTSVTLAGSASDTDGSIASTSWTQTQGTSVTLADSNALSTTFTAPQVSATETLSFTLTATDNEGASSTDSIDIIVNPLNVAPVAEAGSAQTVTALANVTLSGSGTDSDGEIAQYQWTQTAGTSVTISNSDSATASFVAPNQASQLTFELQVTDNRGATATDTVQITVTAPDTYALVDSQQQADQYAPATTLEWSVTNFDTQNHILTWQVTTDAPLKVDSKGSVADKTSTIEFTTLAVHENTNVTVQVTLNDGSENHVMSKTFTMLAQGSVTFNGQQRAASDNLTYLSSVTDTAVMDITGDGFNDIISNSKIAVGSATGQFNVVDISAGFTATDFSIGDINNDGLQDILLTNSTNISWAANSADDSRFSQLTSLTAPENTGYIQARAGDFDGDNDTDIVIVYEAGGDNIPKLAWYENQNGTLAAVVVLDAAINDFDHPSGYPMLTVGNFTNNSKTDIVIATSSTNDSRPNILYAHGDSGFAKSTAYLLTGSDSFSSYATGGIQTIDINQDGFDDILTWQSGNSFDSNNATSYYLINDQDGTFTVNTLHTAYGTEFGLVAADVDGDGDADVVHANNNGSFSCGVGCTNWATYAGKAMWLENLGGTFSTEKKVLFNGDNAYKIHAGDFDNDGDIDVINSADADNTIWYHENKLK